MAAGVFDDAVDVGRSREFLDDSRHHLIAALDKGQIIGMASAVHYVHPDKASPEMWVNELGVSPPFRRKGVATAILNELSQVARDLGCSEVWVLTERDNEAAKTLYQSLPSTESRDALMFSWPIRSN